jgi:hypothetical protein
MGSSIGVAGMSDPKVPPKTEVQSEAAWDEETLEEALGDALNPDGSLDFDKLRSTGLTIPLSEPH